MTFDLENKSPREMKKRVDERMNWISVEAYGYIERWALVEQLGLLWDACVLCSDFSGLSPCKSASSGSSRCQLKLLGSCH